MECLFKPGDWCTLIKELDYSSMWKVGKTFLVSWVTQKDYGQDQEFTWFLYEKFYPPANIYSSYCRLASREEILMTLEQLIEKGK